eukprot:9106328-Alexandrium_andersonii.AAC.1
MDPGIADSDTELARLLDVAARAVPRARYQYRGALLCRHMREKKAERRPTCNDECELARGGLRRLNPHFRAVCCGLQLM